MPRVSENQRLLVLEGCRLAIGWPRTLLHDNLMKHYPVIMETPPTIRKHFWSTTIRKSPCDVGSTRWPFQTRASTKPFSESKLTVRGIPGLRRRSVKLYEITCVRIHNLDVLRYVQYYFNVIKLHDQYGVGDISGTDSDTGPMFCSLMNQDFIRTAVMVAVGFTARMGSVTRMRV